MLINSKRLSPLPKPMMPLRLAKPFLSRNIASQRLQKAQQKRRKNALNKRLKKPKLEQQNQMLLPHQVLPAPQTLQLQEPR